MGCWLWQISSAFVVVPDSEVKDVTFAVYKLSDPPAHYSYESGSPAITLLDFDYLRRHSIQVNAIETAANVPHILRSQHDIVSYREKLSCDRFCPTVLKRRKA